MIIDFDTTSGSTPECKRAYSSTLQFANVLAQYATPLFAPWATVAQNMRSNPAAASAELNTHPATSNRREGRHARG